MHILDNFLDNTMNTKIYYALILLTLTFSMTFIGTFNTASARADQACENQNDREQRFDINTEPDSTSPRSESGVFNSYQNTFNSLGDCPRE